jgi:hypothetical protein
MSAVPQPTPNTWPLAKLNGQWLLPGQVWANVRGQRRVIQPNGSARSAKQGVPFTFEHVTKSILDGSWRLVLDVPGRPMADHQVPVPPAVPTGCSHTNPVNTGFAFSYCRCGVAKFRYVNFQWEVVS